MNPGETVFKRQVPYYPPAGTYFVVKTHGWVPWIVRRATHSWANHAGIFVDDEGGIIEAEPGGVRYARIDEYAGCRVAVNTAEGMTAEQRRIVAQTARDVVGEPYNDLAIVDDGLESLGWRWRWLAKRAAGEHEVICSQVVAVVGLKAGLNWCCGRETAAEVTPADLARRPGMQPWPAPAN